MYPRVKSVKPLEDYMLLITFTNEEVKVFDIKPYLDDKFWSRLKDKAIFKTVKVNCGSIEWLDEIDFCPDEVYEKSTPIENALDVV